MLLALSPPLWHLTIKPRATSKHFQSKRCFWARGSLCKEMEVNHCFELTQRGQLRARSQAGLAAAVTIHPAPKKRGRGKKNPHKPGKPFQFSKENPKSSTLTPAEPYGRGRTRGRTAQGGMAKPPSPGAASGCSSCVCLRAAFLPRQPRPGFVFLGCAGKLGSSCSISHMPEPPAGASAEPPRPGHAMEERAGRVAPHHPPVTGTHTQDLPQPG